MPGSVDAMSRIPKGDIVLLHACCHNPSGMDPDEQQWRAIADIIVERELLPFIDMAYQGFASAGTKSKCKKPTPPTRSPH